MAVSIFARIDTIQGESLDEKHRDEIEVLSWSWGVSQLGTLAQGRGGGRGKASIHELSFTHHFDKASPVLMRACATGAHLKEATITVRRAGQDQLEYLVVRMTDVLVTNVSSTITAEEVTAEGVTLTFGKVDLEYIPQKPDGSLDVGVHFTYDIVANKEG